ncbi:hypothetical protein ASPZODRAFT_130697 [Penicilliopsis zonata CBS 506.65]|uniref:Meiotically up-regulated protein Msb1/Mug8 domain-containing protein n=1 Tax=Penicilliopsis zonata CBS 506.65 TaxID=1073090 RepID=A0A1L9SNJ0_9EURO|nr:hypothetical protein ASPZODRAFT_130697 [Penicilliopsis zonata CBS 506.65]OJJ48607.1 hypothetical protein ASPZODRAFT_130697 [Penicilliopsis zonata CBS 506.65]
MPFFSRVFRGKDSAAAKKNAKNALVENLGPAKPRWTDAWQRTEVAPEEVHDLIRGCTQELKARALDTPFLLLPYRPASDPSAARSWVRNYFTSAVDKSAPWTGDVLVQELRLTDPLVICSVLKWCWSRLPGGVVTWEAYELFKVGEQDSQLARDAFSTFIPISVDSDARTRIIFDFFDLLSAIAAHGKSNGLGGRKLSRYAGWWAFEHTDNGKGFEASYKNWTAAADATSHLFFAYLRSISPDSPRGISGISSLPIALQTLVQATEYPPETPILLQMTTTKVIMIVDTVSPTPFALLRRAKNFEYRDSDRHLQEFASFDDPIQALTDECLRVLRCISSLNQSAVSSSKTSTSLRDASWSRFEDIGFGGAIESDMDDESSEVTTTRAEFGGISGGLRSAPHSINGDLGRPTTPSWADFMSSGFSDENGIRQPPPLLLPPDKVLPPIATVRGQSSQSHKRSFDMGGDPTLQPGELASITNFDLDDSFWWVWISSLAGEEPAVRKAVFGRCALLETIIQGTKWLVLEEQVKGAAPEPDPNAYIVEKKRFFGFTTRKTKLNRSKSSAKKIAGAAASSVEDSYRRTNNPGSQSKTSIAPDQHARIQAAAAALQRKHREEQEATNGRQTQVPDDAYSTKTNSMMTLQPTIMNEASHALKWASNYDKNAYRTAYLADSRAGTGLMAEKPLEKVSSHGPPSPTTTKQPPPAPVAAAAVSAVSAPAAAAAADKDVLPPTPTSPTTVVPETVPVSSPPVQSEVKTPAESAPKKSGESVEDPHKKLQKKKPVATGLKGMFGTGKKKGDHPPMRPTEAEPSAVAAARAALEGKARAAEQSVSPPSKTTPPPTRVPGLKKKPVPTDDDTAVTVQPATSPEPPTSPRAAPATEAATAAATQRYDGPPRTRRNMETDALSRVGTNEQAAADREFSRFDQGPLTEQPAFVPEDSPVIEEASVASQEEAPSSPSKGVDGEASSTIPAAAAASYDRWAQIRKNAAERAAMQSEEVATRYSQDRTDDGDTSGEETIESRVARIKARVAELTGNMEAAR